jgi:hypothetical protein
LTENIFARILGVMNGYNAYFSGYTTQYIDMLNHRFMTMTSEKRIKAISTMAKNIAEEGEEYQALRRDILEEARGRDCDPDDLRLKLDFPEDVEW